MKTEIRNKIEFIILQNDMDADSAYYKVNQYLKGLIKGAIATEYRKFIDAYDTLGLAETSEIKENPFEIWDVHGVASAIGTRDRINECFRMKGGIICVSETILKQERTLRAIDRSDPVFDILLQASLMLVDLQQFLEDVKGFADYTIEEVISA